MPPAQLTSAWRAALVLAWEAYGAGAIPVGAVITDADGLLLAAGRNRIHALRWTTDRDTEQRVEAARSGHVAGDNPDRVEVWLHPGNLSCSDGQG